MKNLNLGFLFFFIILWGYLATPAIADDPSRYYSEGVKTNASADTVLAQTDTLSSGGIIGANYFVSILLNGSSTMTYKLETLNASDVVVSTIHLSSLANDGKLIEPRTKFFIPNGYKMRIRNNTGGILGATHQASIMMNISELIDSF